MASGNPSRFDPSYVFSAAASGCSAGFQTCCVADFQIGVAYEVARSAGLETRDTADLEVCATFVAVRPRCVHPWFHFFFATCAGSPTPCSAETAEISTSSCGKLNSDATNDWRRRSIVSEP